MASCAFQTSVNVFHHRTPPPIYICTAIATAKAITYYGSSSSSTINLHRSFLIRRSWLWRCHATSPESEPPSEKQIPPSSGVVATLTRFQDTLQIFFAVLFWMSLFFWSCAWDGKDNNGRPNKGSRFRK